jgi:hypothetical protein
MIETGPLVAVHASDREWRVACDSVLRARGLRTRLSSRQAELVKSLADGAVAVVIAGPAAGDAAAVAVVAGSRAVLNTTPDDTMETIAHRALELL